MNNETPPNDSNMSNPSAPGNRPPAQPYPGNQGAYPGNQPGPTYPPPQGYAPPQGYPPPNAGPYPYPVQKPFSGKAIASAIIAGATLFFWPIGPISNIVGAIVGFSALKDTKEAGGTHRGRGLAIGGIIGNLVVWLITSSLIAMFVFFFAFAANDIQKQNERYRTERAEQQTRDVDTDLKLIQTRLNLYYIENENSLKPGGPVVNDGGSGGLYPADHPKVTGTLKLTDLVRYSDLKLSLDLYTLRIKGENSAEIRYASTGRTLIVDDVARQQWHFKGE